jgi:hypothetical protein
VSVPRYLHELDAALPRVPLLRARFLREAEDHLSETARALVAAGSSVADAERTACERFGAPAELATRFADDVAERLRAFVPGLVLATAVVFVLPFYVLPENTLPPAPWPEVPGYLAWKHDAAIVAFAVAVGVAVVAAATRAVSLTALAVASLTAATAFSTLLDVEWVEEVQEASPLLLLGVALPLKLLLLAGAAAATFAAARPPRPRVRTVA